jgi:hypothetical protein
MATKYFPKYPLITTAIRFLLHSCDIFLNKDYLYYPVAYDCMLSTGASALLST